MTSERTLRENRGRAPLLRGFIFFIVAATALLTVSCDALTVSPIVLDVVVDPGSLAEVKMKLKNEERQSIRAAPTIFLVTSADRHGFPRYEPISGDSFLARSISFPQGTEYVLGPDEEKEILLRVSVAPDTQPGGRYAVISWGAKELLSGIALSGQPGVNIAIDVRGEVEERLDVRRFGLTRNAAWIIDRPAIFEAEIANTGGRHNGVSGAVTIRNVFGSTITELPLAARPSGDHREPIRILPDTARMLYAVWGEGFAFGPYTAELRVDTGVDGAHVATATFGVISSLALGLAFGLIILTLIFLLLKTLRR